MSDATIKHAGTWRERLTDLLEEQRRAVTQLKNLAQQQGDHIRSGRSDALLSLLSKRQELIDGFLATHNRMQSLLEDVSEQVKRLTSDDRASIRAMIDEINVLLSEVLERDDQDRKALEEARQGVREEMQSMTSGRQARNAYLKGGHAAAGNRFADQQG
jgi:flagellar biosynthesis/type III secretory pathway chaperone